MMTATPPTSALTEHTGKAPQRSVANHDAAFNLSILDFVQRNLLSGFELAKEITLAKSLGEVVELQMAYWQKQFGLTSHAKQPGVSELGRRGAADGADRQEARKVQEQIMPSTRDAKAASSVNTKRDKQSVALAESKVHRKKPPNAKLRKTSRNKKPLTRKK
jgi:hypothetical protein